jgi:hypothetical protein
LIAIHSRFASCESSGTGIRTSTTQYLPAAACGRRCERGRGADPVAARGQPRIAAHPAVNRQTHLNVFVIPQETSEEQAINLISR